MKVKYAFPLLIGIGVWAARAQQAPPTWEGLQRDLNQAGQYLLKITQEATQQYAQGHIQEAENLYLQAIPPLQKYEIHFWEEFVRSGYRLSYLRIYQVARNLTTAVSHAAIGMDYLKHGQSAEVEEIRVWKIFEDQADILAEAQRLHRLGL